MISTITMTCDGTLQRILLLWTDEEILHELSGGKIMKMSTNMNESEIRSDAYIESINQ